MALWTMDPSHPWCLVRLVPLSWRGVAGSRHAPQGRGGASRVGVSLRTLPSRDVHLLQCSKLEPQEHSWWAGRHQSLSEMKRQLFAIRETKKLTSASNR